ncbi:nucleotidyltransferase family protein [Sedimenticola hydrogenitrophicus]|uniref:nucleotidyltransferase family protein n=1 Tax=Sedimenticola hydrogenitrophicus TaxID=2967975 RepID=UPI0021A92B42|nr:nucleotidyltransferase family protein [Sedimenticola hydrogenitrophicus]
MRLSDALNLNHAAIHRIVESHRVRNVRVFGSVLHGADQDSSDIDLLVDGLPSATLLDLGDLQVEMELLPGVYVDLLTPGDLPPVLRAKVLAEARSVGEVGAKVRDGAWPR